MAEAARAKGYEYLAITDHSATHGFGDHVEPDALREQIERVRALNAELDGFELLIGTETNVLPDGSVDYDEELLAELDWVVASVHTSFGMSEADMTARMIAAMEHPYVDVIGHPTGRKIESRNPYAVDMERLIEAALRTHTMLEINAAPDRRDLNEIHARAAAEAGVLIVVDSDAHSARNLDLMPYGIATARRAWLTPGAGGQHAAVGRARQAPEAEPRRGMNARFRAGLRAGAPFGIAGCLLAASFGVLARDVGMPGWAAVLMSVIVFAGSAQIAALTIIGAGGGLGSAIGAAALMNSRFLPMGIAIGPSLPGGPVARAAQGQTVVDASWALASDGEGGFDRHVLFGSSAIQYVGWVDRHGRRRDRRIGARRPEDARARRDLPGVLRRAADRGGPRRPRARRRGRRVRRSRSRSSRSRPSGVPVLVASLASLLGLLHRRRPEPA